MTRCPKDCAIGKTGSRSTPESRQCLRHRIDLVIMSARWKGGAFFNEVVHPRCSLGQVDVMRFHFSGNGMSPRLFAAFGLDGNDAGDLVLQGVHDRRSVRFILDEFAVGLGPLRAQCAHGSDGGAEAEMPAHLIEEEFIGGFAASHLTDHIVGTALVLEGAVPALQHFIEVRWGLLVESPVVALEDAATHG